MKRFLINVLLIILKILIAILAIPSAVVILSAIFIGLTTLVVTGIFLIPIGLVCFLKDYLIEEDF